MYLWNYGSQTIESHHSADTVESSDKGNGDEAKIKEKH